MSYKIKISLAPCSICKETKGTVERPKQTLSGMMVCGDCVPGVEAGGTKLMDLEEAKVISHKTVGDA